jgi:hypothetical protein
MELAGILSGIGTSAMLFSFALWVGVLVYVIARWRSYREAAAPDPQLGLKTALVMFLTIAYQSMLVGGTLLLWAIFTKSGSDGRGDLVRHAFGVLVPSGLVFGAHYVALARTNAAEVPLVPRLFAGVSLIVTGVVGFIALLVLFNGLLARGEAGEDLRVALAATLVYGGAWAYQGVRFVSGRTGRPPGYAPVPPPAVPPPT